jgi:hypothetical protein
MLLAKNVNSASFDSVHFFMLFTAGERSRKREHCI